LTAHRSSVKQGIVSREHVDTNVTGDTGSDLIGLPRLGFVWGARGPADQRPEHPDQVNFALLYQLVGQDRIVDPV